MKLSDYVINFLVDQKVKHVFGITGGAIIHIFDSLEKNKDKITYICPAHEQAAAMAADAYARITKNIGVGIATSGPGATNLLTGVCCSYFDSIPVLMITGQVPGSQLKNDSKSRQIGFQETDVVSIFKQITKYAALVSKPEQIRYELEKAVHIAKSGRPGPVLLDLTDDIQRADIDPEKLKGYTPEKNHVNKEMISKQVNDTIKLLEESKRPIIILGNGVKLANLEKETISLVKKLNIPVALTWATKDMIPCNDPLVIEGFGVSSERAGNFAVQNSDFILALGTRLDTHETGNNMSTFAREARKVIIDIDQSELDKYPVRGMKTDILINCNLHDFMNEISSKPIKVNDMASWLKKINEWKIKYPVCPKEYHKENDYVNPYVFMEMFAKESKEGDILITDAGSNLTWTMQGYRAKKGQILFSAYNHSPMGYSLPASIGAYYASNKPIICIIGDGGIQMNIQELATIAFYNMPIQIFLFNNNGYGIIQQTQDTWLNSRYAASNSDTGVAIPNFIKIAEAYGIPTLSIKNHSELQEGIKKTLSYKKGPILCDVKIEQHKKIVPKLEFGKPIEDSSPLLDREEFKKDMIVKPL